MSPRFRIPILLAGCLVAAGVVPGRASAGSVAGVIEAPPPPGESLDLGLYSKYARPQESAPPAELQGVVALHPLSGHASRPAPSGAPVMDQRGARFLPRIVPVQVGGSVRFLNSDPIFHNVFSLSPTRRFDLGRYPKGDSRRVTFDRAGVVQVFCDIHAEMTGFIVVVESPYFTVFDPDGAFRLDDVPAGIYEVQVWVEGLGRFETAGRVEIPTDGTAEFRARISGAR